jgi:hypothetical protein
MVCPPVVSHVPAEQVCVASHATPQNPSPMSGEEQESPSLQSITDVHAAPACPPVVLPFKQKNCGP